MNRNFWLATFLAALACASTASAQNQRVADANGNLDALVAKHAAVNNVPPDLVRRVIKRESGGNPRSVSQGNYGLMQIKLGTARSMGYRGTAAGLLDADTNMTYAVKYLAGAYHAADGNANRAVHYYASGYYGVGKNRRIVELNTGNAFNAFAFAPLASAPAAAPLANAAVDPAEKLREAQAAGDSVSSSSDPYTGKIDYH